MRAIVLTAALLAAGLALPGLASADATTDFMLATTGTVLDFGARAAALTGGFGMNVLTVASGATGGSLGPASGALGGTGQALQTLGTVNPALAGAARIVNATGQAANGATSSTTTAVNDITGATTGYWLGNAQQAEGVLMGGLDKSLAPLHHIL